MIILPNRAGSYREWEPPLLGEEYVIGVDASEGRDSEADYTSMSVWKRSPHSLEQVAEWFGHMRQGQAGELLSVIGLHYNAALLNVERNISGAIEYALLKMQYPEERMFSPPVMYSSDKAPVKLYFTATTRFNKRTLVDVFALYMAGRGKQLIIRCWELLEELAKLQRDNSNNISLNHQDRAVSAIMAVFADANHPLQFADPRAIKPVYDDPPFGVAVDKWRKRREHEPMAVQSDLQLGIPEFEKSWW